MCLEPIFAWGQVSSLSQQDQIYIYGVSEAMDTRDYGGFILQNNPELREIAEGLNIFPGGGGGRDAPSSSQEAKPYRHEWRP